MRKATNKHGYATAQEIQDAFRIAVILSGGDRKSFILWFRSELDLIVGQRLWISRFAGILVMATQRCNNIKR